MFIFTRAKLAQYVEDSTGNNIEYQVVISKGGTLLAATNAVDVCRTITAEEKDKKFKKKKIIIQASKINNNFFSI